jgi:hypothetical protein
MRDTNKQAARWWCLTKFVDYKQLHSALACSYVMLHFGLEANFLLSIRTCVEDKRLRNGQVPDSFGRM